MRWEKFVAKFNKLPVIDTEIFLAGVTDPRPLKVQISRWQKARKLIQVKRGIYLLAEPYRRVEVCEFYLASLLKKPSYISLEKALEYYDLIPESVSVYTSVTTKRPGRFSSEVGVFDYRHIKNSFFWGYNSITLNKQTGFIASAEKALLDFFYLKGVKISLDYLEEMRLQNAQQINLEKLAEYAKKFKKPGMLYVAQVISKYISTASKRKK